jgi:hypothetical protein
MMAEATTPRLIVDTRLGGVPQYRFTREGEAALMQIPAEVTTCVVFVGSNTERGPIFGGTAFLLGIRDVDDKDRMASYVVTAKHAIAKAHAAAVDDKILIRANLHDGTRRDVETLFADWRYHPDEDYSVDVAAIENPLDAREFEVRHVTDAMTATAEIVASHRIGVGDEVFCTGLFVNHPGKGRNLPIVRAGNIALVPAEKVETEKFGPIDAYLVEVRSIGGLSGSPVFAYMGAFRTYEEDGKHVIDFSKRNKRRDFYLLGLMHGHYDKKTPEYEDYGDADGASSGGESVNIGIGIVVPVTKILEVVNQPIFKKKRDDEAAKRAASLLPTEDASFEADFSKGDMESALRKVSKRQKPSAPDQASS